MDMMVGAIVIVITRMIITIIIVIMVGVGWADGYDGRPEGLKSEICVGHPKVIAPIFPCHRCHRRHHYLDHDRCCNYQLSSLVLIIIRRPPQKKGGGGFPQLIWIAQLNSDGQGKKR